MPIPTTVTFKGMTVSEPLRRAAISRAQKLSQFADDISNCEVTFRSDTHRRHRPNRFCVQVSVSMRGERLGAGYGDQPGVEGDHIYVLLSRAFEALTRRIEDAVRRLRGDVKNHMPPFTVL